MPIVDAPSLCGLTRLPRFVSVRVVDGARAGGGRSRGQAAYVLGSRAAISDASGQNTHGSPGPYESIRTPRGSGEGDRNATVEFKPRTVIPYHHRGQDTTVFRDLVNAADSSINVLLLDWYPAK